MKNQRGFAAFEILLLLMVAGLVAFTAVTVYNHQQSSASNNQEAATASVPSAPTIKSSADLTTAESTINNMDLDANGSDSAALDSQLSGF